MDKLKLVWEKLKREWKTFALQVSLLVGSAWELASQMGADIPSLISWCPPEIKPWLLFGFAFITIVVRKYTPTTVVVPPKDDTVQ